MIRVLIVLSLLIMPGCAERLARANTYATELEEAAASYVRERNNFRRSIREQCAVRVMMRVQQLDSDGQHEEATRVLAEAYPPLMTIEAARTIAGKDMDKLTEIDRPWGC